MAPLERNGKEAAVANLVLPRLVSDPSLGMTERYLRVELNEQGRMRSALVLRLDFFQKLADEEVRLPQCFKSLPSDFVLGSVTCADGQTSEEIPLTVKNVEQECYTNPSVAKTKVGEHLRLPGCKEVLVKISVFDPELRVDTEFR